MTQDTHTASGTAIDRALDAFERRERGIPQARIAAELVAELRAALASAAAPAQQPGAAYAELPDALEALQLKSCPCGATPTALQITGDEQAKWAHVSGNCCGEWEIEYRNNYTKLASTEAMTLAAAAWNEAPRASHGQAPAQAAPAAVAGSSDDLVTRESAMQAIEHLAISNSPGLEDDAIAMLAAAPTTQPAPQQEVQANTKTHDLLGTMIGLFLGAKDKIGYKPGSVVDKVVAEAVEHLKDWPYPEPAPQQEAQEPVAVIGAGFTIFWAGHGPIAPIVERHALKVGSPLYAAPQPSPASQEDALDAMRYRWLRINAIGAYRTNDGKGPVSVYHLSKIPAIPGIPEETDAAIDAASAAQEGKKP